MAWAISAVVSAVAGVVVGVVNGVSSALSFYGIKVFPAVILGGLDSIVGAVLGGLIIGLLENFAQYVDAQYLHWGNLYEIAPFYVLIIILMIRPYGLFGTTRHRAGLGHGGDRACPGRRLPDQLRGRHHHLPDAQQPQPRDRCGPVLLCVRAARLLDRHQPYWLSLLIQIGYLGIAALGLNILVGFTGQISIGHAAFFGFGAFASACLSNKLGVPVFSGDPARRRADHGGRPGVRRFRPRG